MNNIAHLTSATFRNNTFLEMYNRLNPKAELNIIYNDTQYIKKYNLKFKLWKISNNCNIIKNILPDNIEYIFFTEDDVEYPINTLEILYKNINEIPEADCITTSTVCRFQKVPMMWDFKLNENDIPELETYNVLKHRVKNKGIQKIGATSLNCFLIKRDLFNKLIFRGCDINNTFTVDVMFFYMIWCLGFNVYINLDIPTIHDYSNLYKGKYTNMDKQDLINKIRTEPFKELI